MKTRRRLRRRKREVVVEATRRGPERGVSTRRTRAGGRANANGGIPRDERSAPFRRRRLRRLVVDDEKFARVVKSRPARRRATRRDARREVVPLVQRTTQRVRGVWRARERRDESRRTTRHLRRDAERRPRARRRGASGKDGR